MPLHDEATPPTPPAGDTTTPGTTGSPGTSAEDDAAAQRWLDDMENWRGQTESRITTLEGHRNNAGTGTTNQQGGETGSKPTTSQTSPNNSPTGASPTGGAGSGGTPPKRDRQPRATQWWFRKLWGDK